MPSQSKIRYNRKFSEKEYQRALEISNSNEFVENFKSKSELASKNLKMSILTEGLLTQKRFHSKSIRIVWNLRKLWV